MFSIEVWKSTLSSICSALSTAVVRFGHVPSAAKENPAYRSNPMALVPRQRRHRDEGRQPRLSLAKKLRGKR
jgi:hypothetical protein